MWNSSLTAKSHKKFTDKVMAQIEETGSLPFYDTREMTLIKLAMIDKYKPDCVLMGSSRVIELPLTNISFFKECKKPLNIAIWGNNYYSSVLMAKKIRETESINKVLWAWNPEENLNPIYGNSMFLPTEIFLAEKKIATLNYTYFNTKEVWSAFKSLFQLKFIKHNLGLTKVRAANPVKDENSKIDKYGVLTYSDTELKKIKETRKASTQRALELIKQADGKYIKINRWCAILNNSNTENLIAITKTHSEVLNKELASKTKKLEEVCDIKSVKIDMRDHCSEEEQVDKFHYTKSCLGKTFKQL